MFVRYFGFWAILVLAGCDSSSLLPDTSQTTLNLRIEALMGDEPLRIDARQLRFPIQYQVNGRLMSLRTARMYISQVTLIKADGTSHTFSDKAPLTLPAEDASGEAISHTVTDQIFLFRHDFEQDEHFLGLVEAGPYTGLRFKLGIEGLNNRVQAYQVPAADHPLGGQRDRVNFWSTDKGYIFLRFEGLVDADGNGVVESDWLVHLGTADFLNTLELDYDFELVAGEPAQLHLKVDYARFISGIDYSNPDNLISRTTDNLPVARQVEAAIPQAFTFVGVNVLE